jgi:uncharacterized circularly permuted ATP-grasp superfamily protein
LPHCGLQGPTADLNADRSGDVALARSIGTVIAADRVIYAYVPKLMVTAQGGKS